MAEFRLWIEERNYREVFVHAEDEDAAFDMVDAEPEKFWPDGRDVGFSDYIVDDRVDEVK